MESGAKLACELGATTNDIVAVQGNLTLGAGTTLNLYNAGYVGESLANGTYTLITYSGSDPSLGAWTIDYGSTGWSGGNVKLDILSNPKRVYLDVSPPSGTLILVR
jgi:hypothetical protein